MHCSRPVWLEKQGMRVPCGMCRACRIRRSADWTMRLVHQAEVSGVENVIFLTLTYDDEHLPAARYCETGTLRKRDLQLFFKRLRKSCPGKVIKYLACGEYGEGPRRVFGGKVTRGYRPHYHIILYGINMLDSYELNKVFSSWPNCEWTDERKEKSVGTARPDSMRYTCDYIQDKPMGKQMRFDDMKFYLHREFPFQIVSQGMGRDYALAQYEELVETGKILWRGAEVSLPRYYLNKVDVPSKVRVRNSMEARNKMSEKYGFTKIDELISDPFGRLLSEKYEIELIQSEKNAKASARLFSRQNI